MNPSNSRATSYYNRMYKLVEESLDAALYVCNNYMDRFSDAKIFDVFDQTFPTAFILSTGYWIFFVSDLGAPLCVCGRFGIVCRHVRSKSHWIDLQPIAERTESIVFTPKIYGAVIPRKYNIYIDGATECNGYNITIDMDLIYTKKVRKEFHVNIRACYGYVFPCYGGLFSIRFTPNPVLKGNYGTYLNELRIHRAVLINRQFVDDLIVTPYSMPSSGLLLVSVNLIKYDIPAKISAVPLTEWDTSKTELISLIDASTQTTNKNELEDYKKALETLSRSIWQSGEPSKPETQISTQYIGHNMDLKFGKAFPLGIESSEQYDRQFPDMKIKAITDGKASINPICEESIPKPILTPSVQVNAKQSKYPSGPVAQATPLPNFQEAFSNPHQFAKPQSIKRRRGRPKVPKAYNMAVTNQQTAAICNVGSNDLIPPLPVVNPGLAMSQVHSNVEEQKSVKISVEEGLAEFDEILKQMNIKCRFISDEDYDAELDLINELILEKMQNDS